MADKNAIEEGTGQVDGVFEKIRNNYSKLSPSFRRVADYILEHYRDVAFMTAAKVAKKAGVSESVVVRSAVALGYSGYPEMLRDVQRVVQSELSPKAKLEKIDREELSPDMSHQELLARVIDQDISNLRYTKEDLANRSIGQAVETLMDARTVYCLGIRGLNNLSSLLAFLLNMAGITTYSIPIGDATMFQELNRIGEEDVLIAFAFHRYTRRTTRALEIANDVGARTITITDSLTSPAAQEAGIALVAQVYTEVFFNSYCSAVSLINSLVMSCAVHDLQRCRESIEQIEALLPLEDFYN